MAEFPALSIWTDALIGDTFHLTPAEFGAYMRLLICAWRSPQCALPSEDAALGRMIGDPKNWHRIKPAVIGFFQLGDDGLLRQKRLSRERDYAAQCAVRSSAGGRAKALKLNNMVSAKPLLNVCPHTHTHTNKKERIESSFIVGSGRVRVGDKSGDNTVTIKDPSERLARFQKKLAESMGDNGWIIVAAAADPSSPDHETALWACKTAAKRIGKGWPRQWPQKDRTEPNGHDG